MTARQDATYIEVWPPNDDYAGLVRLVEVARDLAPPRPVILAAYLVPFATAGEEPVVAAAKLALATVGGAGGQYLLFGEVHAALVDPYYPRHATLEHSAVRTLRAFTDFSVASGGLLFGPGSGETSGGVGAHQPGRWLPRRAAGRLPRPGRRPVEQPGGGPDLNPLDVRDDPEGITVEVPEFDTWGLLLVEG